MVEDYFEELIRFRNKLKKLFEPWEFEFFERNEDIRSPLLDIKEKKDELIITAEVPGVEKEDIDVEFDSGVLHIKAERKEKKEKKDKDYYYSERRYGGFYRSIRIPYEVDPKSIKATYKNGVLEIKMKKTKKKSAVKVKVN